MQSSSISPWCSQPERTKTERYLAHCLTCVSIVFFASDNIYIYINVSLPVTPQPFPAVILPYLSVSDIDISDQLVSKFDNLRPTVTGIQSGCITNILQDLQPCNPT